MSSNKRLSTEQSISKHTPQEGALMIWLRVLIITRWTAILGVIIATLVATRVFHISFPTLPLYLVCVFMTAYNLVLLRQARSLKAERAGSIINKIRFYGSIHIILDLVTLMVLLHFAGGIENPFIFYLVLHIIGASIALSPKAVYSLATTALLMVVLLVGLEYAGAIPHVNLEGFAPPDLYQEVSYILAILIVLASAFYISTYMATSVSAELRRRQRQVVELRENLLEEKTGQLEQASNEIAKLEEERNRFLRFLGIAAHDLKAPLTAIQGFFWVMLGGYSGKLTDKQRNMLERSSQRIKELLDLISDLLDIPRIKAGTKTIVDEMAEVSLRQVIKRSLDDLSNLVKQKGVKLKAELPRRLPKIYGSPPRLQRVITELLTNATDYSPEGTVTIRVTEEDNDIKIEIMDTGIGIPAEDLPRVFEEFFRASNVQTKGTGLGLSIVKGLVETHGGRIWVESPCPETNTGSKFTFTLPRNVKPSKSVKPRRQRR